MNFAFEDPTARFLATVLVGAGAAFLVHLEVALPRPHRMWGVLVDSLTGLGVGVAALAALEVTTHLAFRFYVLLGIAAGVGLYMGLAAPAVGGVLVGASSFVRRVSLWGRRDGASKRRRLR